jgi:hypothetical protein
VSLFEHAARLARRAADANDVKSKRDDVFLFMPPR